jgi:hypothetical protein
VSERRGSFVDRVLDGYARIDQFDGEVKAWLDGPRTRALHEVLGLGADELDLVASTPDALRYVLHARRFDRTLALDELRGQRRVRSHATRHASERIDPFDLADIEAWATQHVDPGAGRGREPEAEATHA